MAGRIIGLISCNYNDDSFGQLTAARSLASLPFGGRYRLLDFAVSNMVNAGIRTIGLVTPYFYRSIMDHVGAGKEWCLDRKHGGLFLLPGSIFGPKSEQSSFVLRDIIKNRSYLERTRAETVLICGSSKIFNIDFRPMFAAHDAAGGGITMLYKTVNDAQGQSGTYLEVSGGMVQAMTREAAGPVNCFMDCFLIDRKLLLNFCEWYRNFSHVDLVDIIVDNLENLQVQAFPFEGYLGQVRNISDYMRCSQDLLNLEVRQELFGNAGQIRTKIEDNTPAKYSGETVVRNSLVPTGCFIEGTVENSILFRGARVGKGAVVRNSVIMSRGIIQPGALLENVICDKFVTISSGNKLSGTPGKPLVIPKNSEI